MKGLSQITQGLGIAVKKAERLSLRAHTSLSCFHNARCTMSALGSNKINDY